MSNTNTELAKVYSQWAQSAVAAPEDPLDRLDDEELVFEMLKRGYAVAKMGPQDMAEAMK